MSQLVLRLHCKHHVDELLVDFHYREDEIPAACLPDDSNRHPLGDVGWPSALLEQAHPAGQTFVAQEVVSPNVRGRPGTTYEDNFVSPLPADYRWDYDRGVALPVDLDLAGRHVDPDSRRSHVRYEVSCPRLSCPYSATMTRPALFAALRVLWARRQTLRAEVAVIQQTSAVFGGWRYGPHENARDRSAAPVPGQPWPATPMLDADWDTLLMILPRDLDSA